MQDPEITVGIMSRQKIDFNLCGNFCFAGTAETLSGEQSVALMDGKLNLSNGAAEASEILLVPLDAQKAEFELKEVTIGVNFHWEQQENQRFRGKLKLIIENNTITAINILPLEEYLISVISSEMSATSSLELLKAHAIISRSWLLARYQGTTRSHNPNVIKAVNETAGVVLSYAGKICDARFSKCCGGISELFENCWEPVNHPYLTAVVDNPEFPAGFERDLTLEKNAVAWINGSPDAFCNTTDEAVLKQVLNDYDWSANDFYRWTVQYPQAEISDLIRRRSGIDFGEIIDLLPIERGTSGRLIQLKIVGTKRTLIVGKELEIRRWLSESHLYSSAFFVEKQDEKNGIPQKFILKGAGWGHGVGLCQIGAAVMGHKGYKYEEILQHYFKNVLLEKRY